MPLRPKIKFSPLPVVVIPLVVIAGCDPSRQGTQVDGDIKPEVARVTLLDLDDEAVNPIEGTRLVTVFLFTRTDCPISNRYAPEVERLREKFSRGVRFCLVYPDPDQSPPAIRTHLREYGYQCTALRDPEHALVDLTGASVTPEAAVFTPDGRMVYRGRIDNRFPKFGVIRKPSTHELEDVLDALVQGKSVAPSTTKAIGCYIADLK